MTPAEFLSLPQIKKKCALPVGATDLDDLLGTYLDAAIAKIETTTRRNVIDRDLVLQSPDRGVIRQPIRFFAYDAKPIANTTDVRYRAASE